jgi:hypothetical protein
MPFQYRCRKSDNPRYAQVVALAEAIETYSRAKPDEQFSTLRALVKDRTPEVSSWSIRTLGDSNGDTARNLLAGLAAKPDLPLAGQVALDEVQSKKLGEDWLGSEARGKILKSWVTGKADEYDAQLILSRIDMADQTEELPNKQAGEFTRIAAGNKDWPWAARRNAIFFVGLIARRGVDDGPAYDWLFALVRTDRDIEVRRAAAYTIRNHIQLYPSRLKAVEEFLATEPDKEIGEALREAVRKEKRLK